MLRKSRALALAASVSLLALLAIAGAAQAVPATFWGASTRASRAKNSGHG